MFCRIIIAKVDYIIILGDKNNHIMQKKELLYKKNASLSPIISHLGIYALIYI